jgi:hypothetical protein
MEILWGLSWAIPFFAVIFVIASLWQILRALGEITTQLIQIREALERESV